MIRDLRDAGFAVNVPLVAGDREVATVWIGDRAPSLAGRATPIWALDTAAPSPNVRIANATAPHVRLPEQAIEIRVTVDADGMVGKTTELVVEDAGIVVASARHPWTANERWHASLQYLPPGTTGGRLRVRAVPLAGESRADDNAADIGVPAARGPIRTLVAELGVTWPAMFVRRALEGEPAFAVAAVQRAAKTVATRAGTPPPAITRGAIAPIEVAIVGGPDNLTAAEIDVLRWFVEERGGVVALIPDQRPAGRYVDLIGAPAFDARAIEQPARVGGERTLLASELLIARPLPAAARVVAATDSGDAVIFSTRRGAGAVIFSGALDAWRYRDEGFAGFWRRIILDEAAAVPPALDVSVEPPLVAVGETARVTARIRGTELPDGDRIDVSIAARAVAASGRVDVPVRLWPTPEPGVYEGSWRPPSADDYDITVTAADLRGDGRLTAGAAVARGSGADPEGLARAARVSGGRVFPADQASALVDGLRRAYPARRVTRTRHPMRSAWWIAPFASLLCVEWIVRRRQGHP